jgi:hypothetical protein
MNGDEATTMGHRIECPVEWCAGSWIDHGGDGAGPNEWLHSDDGREIVHGAALYRSRRGTGEDVWEMIAGGHVLARGRDLARLAVVLRDIAGAVDTLAS